jgi:hypothetical protein
MGNSNPPPLPPLPPPPMWRSITTAGSK